MPKEIGPHEGRELGLMLAGEKPLAMFSDIVPSSYEWPDALFEPYVSSGVLLKKEFLTESAGGRTVRHLFFALPKEAWRIEEAHALNLAHFAPGSNEAHESCARLGRLLGYSENEIQVFIQWIKGRAWTTRQ